MKVQVKVSEDMLKKIDHYAAAYGMSRSGICAYWIGQSVMSLDAAYKIPEQIRDKIIEDNSNK